MSIRILCSGEGMEALVLRRGVISSRSCAGVIGKDPDGHGRKASSFSFGRLSWVGVWFMKEVGVLEALHFTNGEKGESLHSGRFGFGRMRMNMSQR